MFQWIATLIFLIMASVSDLKFNKVKNKHIMIGIIVGFIINIYQFGLNGLFIASIGFIVPLVIGYPLFLLGFIPAGDIKMFMAIGAINGMEDLTSIVVFTILISGFYSVILLLRKRDVSGFLQFYRYMKSIFITQKISKYNTDQSIKYPLAPLVLISYLVFIFISDML